MSDKGHAPLDAAIALFIRVASAGLVFGLQVLLARLMPADGYGGFVTLWTWMLALGSFAALGFADSSVRFLPRYHLRGRHAALRGFWRSGLTIVLVTSCLAAALAAILAIVLVGLDGVGLTIVLVAIGAPFLAIEYFLEGVSRSFGWYRLAAVPVYILRPLLIAGICLILVSLGVELTLPVVGAVLVVSMAIVTMGLALLVRRRLRALMSDSAGRATPKQRRLWLMASLPLVVLSGLEDLTQYADVLILSLLSEPEVVGIYFAAARALALAGFVAYAMTLVAGRRFALDLADSDRAQLQHNMLEATRLTFWATVVAVIIALLAGPLLLGAFGPGFLVGQSVMLVLGLGLVVRAMSGQAAEMLVVAGRQREALGIGALILVINAALCFALVPGFGIIGAATATAIAMACRTLALVIVLWRVERLRVLSFGLPTLRVA